MKKPKSASNWSLSQPRTKKIDEWQFKSPFPGEQPIVVEVKLETEKKGDQDSCLLFVARTSSGSFMESKAWRREWRSASIDELHQMVFESLDECMAVSTGAVWEDWLEVRVHGRESFGQCLNGHYVDMQYSTIKRGTHKDYPEKVFQLLNAGMVHRFPSAKAAGQPDPDSPNSKSTTIDGIKISRGRDEDYEYSYIKDTPENRAALDSIIEAMKKLQGRLSEVLRQDSVNSFLVGVSNGQQALPNLEKPE